MQSTLSAKQSLLVFFALMSNDSLTPMAFKHLASCGARAVTAVVLGILVDSQIDFSTRNGKAKVFMNKTLSIETTYQKDVINRDRLSTRLIVGKLGH